MAFKFSKRSLENLQGIHPDLVMVTTHALSLSPVDFVVIDGLRTMDEQKILFAKGKSRRLDSRHLTGHAIDFAAWVNGEISWDIAHYKRITESFSKAAQQLGVRIVRGIDWPHLVDADHIELDKRDYP